jgi:hypothetical protein
MLIRPSGSSVCGCLCSLWDLPKDAVRQDRTQNQSLLHHFSCSEYSLVNADNNLYSPILKEIQGGCFEYLVVLSLCIHGIKKPIIASFPSSVSVISTRLAFKLCIWVLIRKIRQKFASFAEKFEKMDTPRPQNIGRLYIMLYPAMNHLTSLAPLAEFNAFHMLQLNLCKL